MLVFGNKTPANASDGRLRAMAKRLVHETVAHYRFDMTRSLDHLSADECNRLGIFIDEESKKSELTKEN